MVRVRIRRTGKNKGAFLVEGANIFQGSTNPAPRLSTNRPQKFLELVHAWYYFFNRCTTRCLAYTYRNHAPFTLTTRASTRLRHHRIQSCRQPTTKEGRHWPRHSGGTPRAGVPYGTVVAHRLILSLVSGTPCHQSITQNPPLTAHKTTRKAGEKKG